MLRFHFTILLMSSVLGATAVAQTASGDDETTIDSETALDSETLIDSDTTLDSETFVDSESTFEVESSIDTIVVTGTRIEQTAAEAGSTVRVIDAGEIEARGFSYALDALAGAPGVTINQNGAFGGAATVRIRGASSDHTLVLVDGVSVNDASAPGGGYNFARLDTESIERIEVLSGPHSTLWGTDAIGGVVSITTKGPSAGLTGDVFVQAGSFGTLRRGASISNAGAVGDFRLAATQLATDGISRADARNGNTEDDGFDSSTLSAQGGLYLPAGVRIDGSVLWNDSRTEFDSFAFGAQGNVSDGDELNETEERSTNLSLTAPLLDGKFDNLLMIGHSGIDRRSFSDGEPSHAAEGERTLFRYQGTLTIDRRNTLAVGAEREQSAARQTRSTLDGLFALYEFRPFEALTLTGGLRSDDHEQFGSETTARLAAAWQASSSVTFRGSWGQGFKAPTIFQTTFFCCGAAAPNEELKPERSEGIDIGAEWRSAGGRSQASIAIFQQDTVDLIDFSFAVGGYENIAEVESRGVEITAGWNLTRSLALSADYAYIKALEGDGSPRLRVPRHSGDLILSFDPPGGFSGTALIRFNGRESIQGGGELDEWTRVDINARYDLPGSVEVFGRIENLFDEHYQQVLGYGTPGRSGSLGARWRF